MVFAKSLIRCFCAFLLVSISLGNPVSSDEVFRNFINDMKSQIDANVKPCEDFANYACGKLKQPKQANTKLEDINLKELVEKYLVNAEPQNNAEVQAKNLYLSCINHQDITKMFEEIKSIAPVTKWPVTEDYSDSDIAKLAGNLATIESENFLSLNLEGAFMANVLVIKTPELMRKKEEEINKMLDALKSFGGSDEENLKIVANIKKLVERIDELNLVNKETSKFNNIEQLKNAVPNFDWDTYFKTIATAFDLKIEDLYTKRVETVDVEYLKSVLDVIKATDSKTVANFLVWKYVQNFLTIDCEKAVTLLIPMLTTRFNEEHTLHQDSLKELEVIHDFLKQWNNIKSQLNHPENPELEQDIDFRKKVAENFESMFTGKYFEEVFGNIQLSETTLYSNVYLLVLTSLKDIAKNGENSAFYVHKDFVRRKVRGSLMNMEKPLKPTIEYFAKLSSKLWNTVMLLDATHENRTIKETCLPYKNEEDPFNTHKNMKYLSNHAGYSLVIQHYLNYVSAHKDEFKRETEILTELGLDHAKAIMLALAQNECSDVNKIHLKDLMQFFAHSKLFSDSWSCVAGDGMYNVCDDSSFVAKI